MSSTDLLGTWEYLGTITPNFEVWTEFPTFTSSGNSLVRATYYGRFNRITSKGFLRAVYRVPAVNRDRRWIRLWPKPETEIITVGTPQEILLNNESVQRYYEVIKRPKHYRIGFVEDDDWSVALECLDLVNLPQSVQQLISLAPTDVVVMNQLLLLLKGANNG